MRCFVRGDLDGFFGLALDNLVQLLLIDLFCRSVLGFPEELLYGRVLPGVAVSLLVGNLWYGWLALREARRLGRDDLCALPYGINTVSLIGHVFLVMLPARLAAEAAGAADPARVAWQAGLLATVGSGLIESGGAFVAERIRRATPRAALLATLSSIALGFISLGFVLRMWAHPLIGLPTLGVVFLAWLGGRRFRGGLPGGLVAVALGTLLAWLTGLAPAGETPARVALHLPVPVLGDLQEVVFSGAWLTWLSVILPMGIANVVGSLQNLESAEAAGDSYPTRSALLVNGLGTLAAAAFGSCFPTTIYIGHPGWKAMGARAGYSVLNGLVMTVLCLTGSVAWFVWAVPVDAGAAILLYIGVVITAQAFQATPRAHALAVVVGLLPGVAAWGVYMLKAGLRGAGYGQPGGPALGPELLPVFARMDLWLDGALALEQGFIFTSMVLAAATVAIIEGRLRRAAAWAFAAAGLAAAGLIHSYRWLPGDTAVDLRPAWEHVQAYALLGLLLLLAPVLTRPRPSPGDREPPDR